MRTLTKVLLIVGGCVIGVTLINYLRLLTHDTQWLLFVFVGGGAGLFYMVRSMRKEFAEGD